MCPDPDAALRAAPDLLLLVHLLSIASLQSGILINTIIITLHLRSPLM